MADARIPVAALLLNWRQAESTLQCFVDLLECGHDGLRILIMDNGSGDGSLERLQSAAGDAEVIGFEENLGYCAAMNRVVVGPAAGHLLHGARERP